MVPNNPKIKFKHTDQLPSKLMDWIGSPGSLVLHTILFAGAFILGLAGLNWDRVLLVLTTVVSLEAIYMAIFIQMGVNRTTQSLQDVQEDVEEIQEDVGEIQEDVQGLGEEMEDIQENMEDIQEDIDEMSEEDLDGQSKEKQSNIVLNNIESQLQFLIKEIEILKGKGTQK